MRKLTIVYKKKLYRCGTDVNPPVEIHQLMAHEITDSTPVSYSEQLAWEEPAVMVSGSGWKH